MSIGACGSKRPPGEQQAILDGCEERLRAAVTAARLDPEQADEKVAQAAAGLDPLCVSQLHEELTSSSPDVRRTATRIMKKTPQFQHVKTLVANLGVAREPNRAYLAEALKELTGQDHGEDAAAWKRWLESSGGER
jgi:hypothetical protein